MTSVQLRNPAEQHPHSQAHISDTFAQMGSLLFDAGELAVSGPKRTLLVLRVAVGYELDQVVVGVAHVQTGPGALGA
jgi:hypothetical protein